METMRYTERKKSSKGFIIGLFLFILLGGGFIYYAIQSETDPTIIGSEKSDINRLVDIDANTTEEKKKQNASIQYEVKEKEITDHSNDNLSGELTLPEIFVEGVALTDVNDNIEKDYHNTFSGLKTQMLNASNQFKYVVSYEYYDNMVSTQKIVSFIITQKIYDIATDEVTMEKINTYNVDVATKKLVAQDDIAKGIIGINYKGIIRNKVLAYLVEKNIMSEEEFNYTITGLENFYIKEGKLYIVFNPSDLTDKEYGILEILIEE